MGRIIPGAALPISDEELATVTEKLLAGEDVAEKEVVKFENDLAAYLGVKKAFASNSGRTALYMALQALNLEPGEEVIVPAYTCAIVFEVVFRLGLKPVLVDVDPCTYNIDPDLVLKAVASDTKAIIPVHLFGRPCEMDHIMEIAEKHHLYVIENVAQALGAEYKKFKVGTFGDLAIFSFGPGKSMTSGEGGAMVVNNEEIIENIIDIQAKLGNPNFKGSVHVLRNIIGMRVFSNPYLYPLIRNYVKEDVSKTDAKIFENCGNLACRKDNTNLHHTVRLEKMPAFCAKIARIQLRKLDKINQKRIINATTLTKLLSRIGGSIGLPEMRKDVKNTFTRYPVKLVKGSREKVVNGLIERGIEAAKPYDYLTGLFKLFNVNTFHSATISKSIFTIPNHPLLKSSDVLRIVSALRELLS